MKLNGIEDTKALIEEKAVAAKVLFVPGQAFSPTNEKTSYVRASFSIAEPKFIDTAIQRLAQLIKDETE